MFVFDFKKTISLYARPDSCIAVKDNNQEPGTPIIITDCEDGKGLYIEPLFFHANRDEKFLLTPKDNPEVAMIHA